MTPRTISLLLWLGLVLGLAACRGCFLPDRDLDVPLTNADVIGAWHLTPESRALLERDGLPVDRAQTYSMTLSADGSVQYASVDLQQSRRPVRLAGTWDLVHHPPGLDAERANVLRLSLTKDGAPPEALATWGFTRTEGDLRMWAFHGDPDSWEFVEYARVD